MQILNFIVTAIINISIAAVLFFFLILLLNGYTGSQADPGLILYIVWALLCSLIAAALSVLLAKYLTAKKWVGKGAAFAISAPIFVIVGGVAHVAGIFAAVILIQALL